MSLCGSKEHILRLYYCHFEGRKRSIYGPYVDFKYFVSKKCHFEDPNVLFCVFKVVFCWVSREDYVKLQARDCVGVRLRGLGARDYGLRGNCLS